MAESSRRKSSSKKDENQDFEAAASKMLTRTQSISIDTELAEEVFQHFMTQAATLKSILRTFRYLCDVLRLKPQEMPYFYPKLKSKLTSWKANALWAKFDKRAGHKVYMKGKACAGQRVLVIGAGPCGLRTAIEAQLLGAKVVVLEKRDRYSRNNVLHLWPYNIHDLRGLGAKKFYGKFCAGSIDHISIRALQCILLKVALLMGVEVYENCGFEDLVEPVDVETGWKAKTTPEDHPVSQFEFDVLIGADGKRNTLRGFRRKEFRGKLAIAITANFINKHTDAEGHIEEISGVAFIFNQKFFNDLNEAKGINLENIVYYKDETHYFVMTAKKQSLMEKGVIKENEADTEKLLSMQNVNQEKLFEYAREAADYATEYKMPHLDFAVNHYGKPDVAMFDFTSMFQAENSCRVIERHGHRLLTSLVGDSLLEPFWPTGTGCARGFFGGLDACWLMRTMALGKSTLCEAIAERESIYKLLAQTTPANTSKDYASYNVDPNTRYPNLNSKLLSPHQVTHLVDTDNPSQLQEDLTKNNNAVNRKRKESTVGPDALLTWLAKQVEAYERVVISDMTTSFQSGLALCAIIHRYRPDLIDFHTLEAKDCVGNLQLAFEILDHELGISPLMKASELADVSKIPDKLTVMSYLSQIYECFRREIPACNNMETIPEEEKMTLGQMAAKKAAKKRKNHRSASHEKIENQNDTKEDIETLLKADGGESHNKENVSETARLNRSANRKRLLNLMQRAEQSAHDKKKSSIVRKSIKEEERFKIIENMVSGKDSKRRSGDHVRHYRENKKPKELKRAIGRIDKDDWNIQNIEQKLVVNSQVQDVKKDKVPKWSKAAFQDKFNIMKAKCDNGKDDKDSKKYSDIDSNLAKLQRKLREGSALETGERGSNRVSALAEELFDKQRDEIDDNSTSRKSTESRRSSKKSSVGGKSLGNSSNSSENCHFCHKRVYVVERMSAEGKFFHRSCFRCDYCNILLRLGSYVYHRDDGTAFSGKFFCIPHSTENALEKYRYRKKADEIKDAENRKYSELLHQTTQDWASNPSYINRHKDRLNLRRGATPERAEFEASLDPDSQPTSIMDEDEWTEQNFGGNSLVLNENTSEDSVSDLDSDEEGDEDDEENDKKPLTAKEARQLQRAWLKQRMDDIRNGASDPEMSQYDNVKDLHSSSEDEIDEDEEDIDADYEDSEYESTESELDEGCSNIKLTVPLNPHPHHHQRKKRCPHNKKVISSTEHDSESTDEDSDTEDSESDSESEESESESVDEFSGSETNTECDFTDSEGRPNPFHKELEVPSILIDAGSPEVPGMRRYPEDIIEANTRPAAENNSNYSGNRLYKTPNLADKPKEPSTTTSNYIGRSTARAFNLKKHWVSDASNAKTNDKNSMGKTEVDNRLKSLMDRLSNQQKLLKPAEKPSKQMEHFMSSGTGPSNGMKSISSDPLVTSPSMVPSISRQTSENQKLHYAPPYQSIMNGIQIQPKEQKPIENPFVVPSVVTNGIPPTEEEEKPPRPPTPKMFQEPSKVKESKPENLEPSPETTFESCNQEDIEEHENQETILEPSSEAENSAFLTPANELSLNPEDLKESDDIPLADCETTENQEPLEPLATSSPAVVIELMSPTESEKSFIRQQSDVKLTDDEIMRIYQERNPLERLAKFNSYKKKQSSVVHDMILSASANKPRTRRTRVAIPSSSIPDPNNPNVTPIAPPRTRAATEPPMSLPATPLTDPAKFGIPVARNSKKSEMKKSSSALNDMEKLDGIVSSEDTSLPASPQKPKLNGNSGNKKTFMQTISGIFSKNSITKLASPEDSLCSPTKPSKNDLLKFLKPKHQKSSPVSSPEAPRANLSEISNDDNSSSKILLRQSSKLSMKASHPSTPPVPLSRKITIIRHASDESLSDLEELSHDSLPSIPLIENSKVPPEIMEKLMKRGGSNTKSAKRLARVAHIKRVRKAQEIQRQLEELDVMHKELEERGIEAEKSLRGETPESSENSNPDLLQTWFILLAEKNALVRHEQELLVQAKELEWEDSSCKLEGELREHLLLDSRSNESVSREASILKELLSIAEKGEKLQNMLRRDKQRYLQEDQDIEAQMKAKGLRLGPVRKLSSLSLLDTSSTA